MDYLKIYKNLVNKERNFEDIDGEWHHIIPKCLGGNNESYNLVKLTYSEHYLAHLLLLKIYPNNLGLATTVNLMSSRNNKEFGWARAKMVDLLKGRKLDQKTKDKISRSKLGHVKSEETKEKIRNSLLGKKRGQYNIKIKSKISKGVPLKESTKQAISNAMIGAKNPFAKKVIINDVIYDTLNEASIALSMSTQTVRRRLKSSNYPTWNYYA